MKLAIRSLVVGATLSVLMAAPAEASNSVTLDGSFAVTITKPAFTSRCPSGTGDECGVVQLIGLGAADYVYTYGPTFEPTGTKGCFNIDGTFGITLQSDGSMISGPLVGVFCVPGGSAAQLGTPSYGGPRGENDSIDFSGGTGQFAGLHGVVAFTEFDAGARLQGSLNGTLSS
jgi:hypothetical protein